MVKKKEFKHALLITIFIVILIFAAFIFLNKPKENHSDAEHFLVTSGFELGDYFKSYQIAAVVRFINNLYPADTVKEMLSSVFTEGNGDGKKTDEQFLSALTEKMEADIVKTATDKMLMDFNNSMSHIAQKADQESFKTELLQRLRGFLVEYNKERIRLNVE
jgi:hypothetical protein